MFYPLLDIVEIFVIVSMDVSRKRLTELRYTLCSALNLIIFSRVHQEQGLGSDQLHSGHHAACLSRQQKALCPKIVSLRTMLRQ